MSCPTTRCSGHICAYRKWPRENQIVSFTFLRRQIRSANADNSCRTKSIGSFEKTISSCAVSLYGQIIQAQNIIIENNQINLFIESGSICRIDRWARWQWVVYIFRKRQAIICVRKAVRIQSNVTFNWWLVCMRTRIPVTFRSLAKAANASSYA